LRKVDLQKEGFDPAAIKDLLLVRGPAGHFEPLTPEIYRDIQNGKMKL
jgi:solute carrier family 27 fatty acid transporter 1/4